MRRFDIHDALKLLLFEPNKRSHATVENVNLVSFSSVFHTIQKQTTQIIKQICISSGIFCEVFYYEIKRIVFLCTESRWIPFSIL